MPAISVTDLHKSYGPVQAVRGVSFDVDAGEVVAVLGPNGAGKTTIVEILEGYRHADRGTVRVLGLDPASAGVDLRRRIGIVLQECGFDAFVTVREVLEMHAGYYPAPLDVHEVLELVGLTEKADSRIRKLSGGQQRRVDLALGLIGDPELLFLDEPTTGFDPAARRQSWELVRRLTGLGKTLLLTTHYLDEAQALADRVILVADGRVLAEGTPDDIGGRMDASTRVEFDVAEPHEPPIGTRVDAARWCVETSSPTRDLHTLTSWALDRGIELGGLHVAQPSLEDVYLRLLDEPASGAEEPS